MSLVAVFPPLTLVWSRTERRESLRSPDLTRNKRNAIIINHMFQNAMPMINFEESLKLSKFDQWHP